MGADPVTLGKAVVEVGKALFGKLGPVILFATGAFLFLPVPWIKTLGLDNTQPDWKRFAGVLFVLSAAACLVELAIIVWTPFLSWREKSRERARFHKLPIEVKALMAVCAVNHTKEIWLPFDSEVAQLSVDHHIFWASPEPKCVNLELTRLGRDLVSNHRGELRALLMPESLQQRILNEIEMANRERAYL